MSLTPTINKFVQLKSYVTSMTLRLCHHTIKTVVVLNDFFYQNRRKYILVPGDAFTRYISTFSVRWNSRPVLKVAFFYWHSAW
jgi:hypothetical protein